MAEWLLTLSLRAKLWGVAALGILAGVGYFFVRYRWAVSKAAASSQRADAFERARDAELRISERRAELQARDRKLRTQIEKRTKRDYFEGGWTP